MSENPEREAMCEQLRFLEQARNAYKEALEHIAEALEHHEMDLTFPENIATTEAIDWLESRIEWYDELLEKYAWVFDEDEEGGE